MNQQNPNQQIPSGQPPPTQQQGQPSQQVLSQQQQVNLAHPNDVPNANWRNEVSVPDRSRFVSQLSLALKHLSPSTSDSETYNVASNFEAGLYQRCTSKNQYILAYAKKFQHIREQINQSSANNTSLNGLSLQQPMSPLVNNAAANNGQVPSPQLQRHNFQSPLNLNQQQQLAGQQMRPAVPPNFGHQQLQQGRPPQQVMQSPAQQAQAQMLAYQRSAAAAAMAASNAPQMMQQQRLPGQQIPLNLLNMNAANAAQAGLNISPQQFQMYFARQMALQQQQQTQQQQQQQSQQQQSQQQQPTQQQQQQQQQQQPQSQPPPQQPPQAFSPHMLPQQPQQPQQQNSPIQQQGFLPHVQGGNNMMGMTQQQLMNMGLAGKPMMGMNNVNFRPQAFPPQQQQQQDMTQANTNTSTAGSPMQSNTVVNYPNAGSASSTPVTVPATLSTQPFNNTMVRPPPSSSGQPMNQELLMQRFQQQQQQQNMMQRPPMTQQQFVPQQQGSQMAQRPLMNLQQPMQPNMIKPLTIQQRNNAAGIVRQIDENVRQGRVRGVAIEDMSEEDKSAIREQIGQMRPMYDKIDNLLPVFLALTSNVEATRRLVLMKYMFEDQLNALPHNKYIISLENLHKLREQFSGYFTWVRNAVGHQQQQQQQQMNAMVNPMNPQQQQQQQVGLGLMPMPMQQQSQQQMLQQQPQPQQQQASPIVNFNPLGQQGMVQHGMMGQQATMTQAQAMSQSQAQALAMLRQQQQAQAQMQQQQQQSLTQSQEQASNPTANHTGPKSNENTPVMANASLTNTPTTPSMSIKRGSIDLKLPPTKKQRGSRSAAQSPTLSRKNQKTNEKEKAQEATPASASNSPVMSSNSNITLAHAMHTPPAVSTAMSQSLPPSQSLQQQQQGLPGNNMNGFMPQQPGMDTSYPSGIPVKAGMPLSQHQAQSQAFYMAAVSNGIPPQIVNLLPHKALQCNWILQQAAQNKMTLMPNQQQQLQAVLNEQIEMAKQQLAQQNSGMHDMTSNTPASLANVSSSPLVKTEEFTASATPPPPPPSSSSSSSQQQSRSLDNNSQIPTSNNTSNSNMIVQPSMTLHQSPSEDMMSSFYFSNDMMDNPIQHQTQTCRYPASQPNTTTANTTTTTAGSEPMKPSFEAYSSALKEGYKDETFGTPDLTLMKPSAIKQEESFETNDLQSSWYDSTAAIDLGLDGFDWDNNDFVKLDDNDAPANTNTGNNNNEKNSASSSSQQQQDDKKLIDESGKLCAVSL